MNKYIEYSSDDELFKALDPYSNTKLSNLKGHDLLELVRLIDNFYLIYRKKLGIDKNITYGFEVEIEHANENAIEEAIDNLSLNKRWQVSYDGSLDKGAEIISPVLTDKKSLWEDFLRVSDAIHPYATIDKHAGSHIHIGSQILGKNKEAWKNLLILWSTYENIIYRFLYGEYLSARPIILEYACPVSEKLKGIYMFDSDKKLKKLIYSLLVNVERYSGINFQNVDRNNLDKFVKNNTIEFRAANGTMDPIIWQNNLNTLVNFLLYTKNSKFDLDTVIKRRNETEYKFELYDEIYLDQALEFCDLIFNNNYDKVYFLKQYLKGFEFQDCKKQYSKAKELTKK